MRFRSSANEETEWGRYRWRNKRRLKPADRIVGIWRRRTRTRTCEEQEEEVNSADLQSETQLRSNSVELAIRTWLHVERRSRAVVLVDESRSSDWRVQLQSIQNEDSMATESEVAEVIGMPRHWRRSCQPPLLRDRQPRCDRWRSYDRCPFPVVFSSSTVECFWGVVELLL